MLLYEGPHQNHLQRFTGMRCRSWTWMQGVLIVTVNLNLAIALLCHEWAQCQQPVSARSASRSKQQQGQDSKHALQLTILVSTAQQNSSQLTPGAVHASGLVQVSIGWCQVLTACIMQQCLHLPLPPFFFFVLS
jgi:hypothetical protein